MYLCNWLCPSFDVGGAAWHALVPDHGIKFCDDCVMHLVICIASMHVGSYHSVGCTPSVTFVVLLYCVGLAVDDFMLRAVFLFGRSYGSFSFYE